MTNMILTREYIYTNTNNCSPDGTTDVTRTLHFGTPTADQKATYTRLVIGVIQIGSAIFPSGTTLSNLEILARGPLYSQGRDYGHGTTHGIGHFLGVHEGILKTYRF
jgi:Xaa-Pro aminopeptidase